jgi:Xaa-Pro aminopeptidase
MRRDEDFLYKITIIRDILKNKNYDGIEIKSQVNFSFITRGREFIGLASVMACGSLLITQNKVYLLAENIEATRLYKEQLNSNPLIEVLSYPWDEQSIRNDIRNNITKELKIANEEELATELFELRTVMTTYDKSTYKELSKDCAVILENICKNLKQEISEYELAGEISKQFWSANIEPITILIAFDERALQYRHPVMTDNKLKNYAMVGVCGRRNGLITSLTRNVLINNNEKMVEKHYKCAKVNAAYLSELKVGNSLEYIFNKGVSEYEEQKYPLEYKKHHQGGLTGFMAREIKANIGCSHIVRENEVYAFNPTIQGSKCEDTVLITNDGLDVMTYTGNYEYISFEINNQTLHIPTVYVINK